MAVGPRLTSFLTLAKPRPVGLDVHMKNKVGRTKTWVSLKAYQCPSSVILSVRRDLVMCGFHI